jgi:hypothetical protein
MTLVAKHICESRNASGVKRITFHPSGNLYVIEYEFSPVIMISINKEDKLVTKQFIEIETEREIGSITAVSFLTSQPNMILTYHRSKFRVWAFDEITEILTLVSEGDAVKDKHGCVTRIKQIVSHSTDKFILRTSDSILVVQLESEYKKCRVLMSCLTDEECSFSIDSDFTSDSMALFGNILILVIPSQNIVKFFLVGKTEVKMMLKKCIETPLCWSFNSNTSVFSLYYESCTFIRQRRIMV